ncbi:MAG: hemin uptake protein HemP [Planctomycetaceae bacterium]
MTTEASDGRAPQPPKQNSECRSNHQHPEFDFDQLAQGEDIIHIRCGEEVYQLRRTRAGRLLLNK